MTAAKVAVQRPTLDLVRKLTDRHVIEQLLATDTLTRAELAARTGISKPTASESVRRLLDVQILEEAGHQQGKRGPAGTYYRLRPGLGVALAVSAGPDGVVVDSFDLRGQRLGRFEHGVPSPIDAARLSPVLVEAVSSATTSAPGPVLSCAVSVAGPVDHATGRLVRLPNAPFLLDEFAPQQLISAITDCPVTVDNDVNWMALAEHDRGAARGLGQFLLCYLGAGIGSAIVIDAAVFRGSQGVAGELAYVSTAGPGGRTMRLLDCFAAWDLRQPGSDAIDTDALRVLLADGGSAARSRRAEIAGAVATAIASSVAVLNPAAVLIGGPWGSVPGFTEEVADQIADRSVLRTEVRRVQLGGDSPQIGAGLRAVQDAQSVLVARLGQG
jgi:predicted NBD/HSP70 family sugar kinase